MSSANKPAIAILGCSGFIGSHILERLLREESFTITGIDLASDRIEHLLQHPSLTFIKADIHKSQEVLQPVLEKCETVLSLAALCNPWLYNHTPIDVIESNFVAMYPVIKLCADSGCRIIHFSTSEVYGRTLAGSLSAENSQLPEDHYLLHEKKTPFILGPVHNQRWSYACAKQLLERTLFAYGYERNLNYTIVRPFNFIGPGMDYIPGVDGEGVPRVIACFMESLLREKPLQLVDGGTNRRCFTAIDDAVEAVMRILTKPDASSRRIFNIGNPQNETTIGGLARKMIACYVELTGTPVEKYRTAIISSEEFYGEGYEDSDRRVPDISAASEHLGWTPRFSLDEALESTIRGFIATYSESVRKSL